MDAQSCKEMFDHYYARQELLPTAEFAELEQWLTKGLKVTIRLHANHPDAALYASKLLALTGGVIHLIVACLGDSTCGFALCCPFIY